MGWGTAQKWYSYTRKTQAYVSWSVSSSSDGSVTFSVTGCARSGDGGGQYYASGYTVNVEIWYRLSGGGWVSLGSTSGTLNYGNSVASITKSVTINRTASAQTIEFWTDASSPSGYWPTATSSMSTSVSAHPTYAPSAPSSVTASFSGNTVVVKWQNNSSTWAKYDSIEIQVQASGGAWTVVSSSLSGSATKYSYSGSSTAYYAFRVRAKNSKGTSSYATSQTLWGTPAAPSSVTISKTSATSVAAAVTASWSTGAVVDVRAVVDGAASDWSTYQAPQSGQVSASFQGMPPGASVIAQARQRFATPGNASSIVSSGAIVLAYPPSPASSVSATMGDASLGIISFVLAFEAPSEDAPRSSWTFVLTDADSGSRRSVTMDASSVSSGTAVDVTFDPESMPGRVLRASAFCSGDGGSSSESYAEDPIYGPVPTSGYGTPEFEYGWSETLGYHVSVSLPTPFGDSWAPDFSVSASGGLSVISHEGVMAGSTLSYDVEYDDPSMALMADAGSEFSVSFSGHSFGPQSVAFETSAPMRQAWHVEQATIAFGNQTKVGSVWHMPFSFASAMRTQGDDSTVELAGAYSVSFSPSSANIRTADVPATGAASYSSSVPFSTPGVRVFATVVAGGSEADGWASGMPVVSAQPFVFVSPKLSAPSISSYSFSDGTTLRITVSVATSGERIERQSSGQTFLGYNYELYSNDALVSASIVASESTPQGIEPLISGSYVGFTEQALEDWPDATFDIVLDMPHAHARQFYVMAKDGDTPYSSARSVSVAIRYAPETAGVYCSGGRLNVSDCVIVGFEGAAIRLHGATADVSSSRLAYNSSRYEVDGVEDEVNEFGVFYE